MLKELTDSKPDIAKLPGGWEPHINDIPIINGTNRSETTEAIPGALLLKNVLSIEDCHELMNLMELSPNHESVSVQGNKDVSDSRIGSTRTTIWAPRLADSLWDRIQPLIGELICDEFTLTDWHQGDHTRQAWIPISVSPLLRFMRYDKGGKHYAHYDAGYIYNDDSYRTLDSIVIYLTKNDSGATRFVDDKQSGPVWDRNHNDWTRETQESEVLFESLPYPGNILLFNHRMCHDVGEYLGHEGPRIIIRGDIVYKSRY